MTHQGDAVRSSLLGIRTLTKMRGEHTYEMRQMEREKRIIQYVCCGRRPPLAREIPFFHLSPLLSSFLFLSVQCSRLKSSMPFKRELAPQNIPLAISNPSKRDPKLEMKTSLGVLDVICPPQKPTSVLGRCHYKKWR